MMSAGLKHIAVHRRAWHLLFSLWRLLEIELILQKKYLSINAISILIISFLLAKKANSLKLVVLA